MNIDKSKLCGVIHDTLEFCSGCQCDLCDCEKFIRGSVCRSKKIVQNIELFCTSDGEKKREEPKDVVVTLSHKDMYTMYAALATLKTSAAILENVNGCRTLSTIVKAAHDDIAAICKEEE